MLRRAVWIASLLAAGAVNAAGEPEFALAIRDRRFTPAEITVPANVKVKLVVDNQDAAPEEFDSHALNREKVIPGKSRSAEPEITELGYQWQLKYRWRPEFEFGAQGFGDVGKWDDWAPAREQEHIVGLAIFGKFIVGEREVVKYNAAVLFGVSSAAPDRTLRAQLEYEF